MKYESCPVCHANTLNTTTVGRTQALVCAQCAVVLSLPSTVQPTTYYAQGYSLTSTVRVSTEFHRYFRYPEYQHLLSMVSQYVKPPASILDIGCDHGYFLDDARRFGYTVTGVEPSEGARQYAQSIGLNVVQSLDDVHATTDVVTMWHVLEHIADPSPLLQSIFERLRPQGRLLIRVPDFGCLPATLLKDRWIWFQPHHHAIHYTKESLRTVLEQNNFSVELLQSQRPNNRLTKRAYHLASAVMRREHGLKHKGLRSYLGRLYQDVTGVELLAIAKPKGTA